LNRLIQGGRLVTPLGFQLPELHTGARGSSRFINVGSGTFCQSRTQQGPAVITLLKPINSLRARKLNARVSLHRISRWTTILSLLSTASFVKWFPFQLLNPTRLTRSTSRTVKKLLPKPYPSVCSVSDLYRTPPHVIRHPRTGGFAGIIQPGLP